MKEELMNEQDAIFYIADRLKEEGLYQFLTCQLSTLLKENRRNAVTPSWTKTMRFKGNKHTYGTLPFVKRSGKAMYSENAIDIFLHDAVIPHLDLMYKPEPVAA